MSNEEEPQEHPDAILDEVKSIIDNSQGQVAAEDLMKQLTPFIGVISGVFTLMQRTGFSQEAAEEMCLTIWHNWWPDPWYGRDNDDD